MDYSLMGRRLQETGPSHEVHVSYYANMRNSKNSVLIIENVTEYKEALVKRELGGQWDLVSIRVDPRLLGLPCSRARVFMICWKREEVRWVCPFTLHSFVECLRSQVTMNAGAYFFKDLPKAKLTPSAAPLCGTGVKARNQNPTSLLFLLVTR